MNARNEEIPEHLRREPALFVRRGSRITAAAPEDLALARTYPLRPGKGSLEDGRRITILLHKSAYAVNEEIHVLHVYEVTVPGVLVSVMGPKPVPGEYVDGQLATSEPVPEEDPFLPSNYNGRAIRSPAVDYNYEITVYRFSEPGRHQIEWRAGGLRSNAVSFEVV